MFVEDLDAEACVYQGEGLSDEFSNQHWQSKTAAVADDYMKLKFQLETAQRDKDRDAVIILSLKHVYSFSFIEIYVEFISFSTARQLMKNITTTSLRRWEE